MSSVSEQDHLNPRDPLYYAPRSLRERSGSIRDADPPYSLASFDSKLEGAVSNALQGPVSTALRSHPLDPEVVREPEQEKRALWTIAARFGAAIGVAAAVALFFVIVVPGSRQADSEQSTFSNVTQSIKGALFPSGDALPKPAISEFQGVLAAPPPASAANSEQSAELLKQFMQWREAPPSPATPQRANQ